MSNVVTMGMPFSICTCMTEHSCSPLPPTTSIVLAGDPLPKSRTTNCASHVPVLKIRFRRNTHPLHRARSHLKTLHLMASGTPCHHQVRLQQTLLSQSHQLLLPKKHTPRVLPMAIPVFKSYKKIPTLLSILILLPSNASMMDLLSRSPSNKLGRIQIALVGSILPTTN